MILLSIQIKLMNIWTAYTKDFEAVKMMEYFGSRCQRISVIIGFNSWLHFFLDIKLIRIS